MKIFKPTENVEIVCDWKKTRMAFKHTAVLFKNGRECESTKICYQNRTWERYEYQSVLLKVINASKSLSDEEKKLCVDYANRDNTDWSAFKATSAIAMMGDLLCSDQKEKNDWKARMLKAGLGNKGLEMPEDWDSLSEDTKTARLDAVIGQLKQCGKEEE